ncbi:hypothetical protein P153DRAFT_367714 [Dothidotthia symphoricarpi CBS 119687]|uniref:F-box domain-containing protein n=1 Tax=Dothidotthia symphoricarpi CBS 119687 TaxID=1392245 RepID=A0A6A6A9G4_9PLEO|nr:uncharacterized protein P153DRAFT_367714 [Dothidotthia symphoricarpi CBS 119687]KAF2128602.1 hypothetical protein P153DRAFT_367714 [Dothidotthia symphoricarpi CBS 119687]
MPADAFASLLAGTAPELLGHILTYLCPRDLASVAQICKHAAAFLRPGADNTHAKYAWKAAFLQVFDHPKYAWERLLPTARAENASRHPALWDWFHETHRRYAAYNAYRVACDAGGAKSLEHLESIIVTLLDIHETASYTAVTEDDTPLSLNLEFLSDLVGRARDFDLLVHNPYDGIDALVLPPERSSKGFVSHYSSNINAATHHCYEGEDHEYPSPSNTSQDAPPSPRSASVPEWASKFHIFSGSTERELGSVELINAARRIVYDFSVTGPRADYGPFHQDDSGRINWKLLEAISSLMHHHFEAPLPPPRIQPIVFPPRFEDNIPHMVSVDPSATEVEDWAGITGPWLGNYSGVSFSTLVKFNSSLVSGAPMHLGRCQDVDAPFMNLKLQSCSLEDSKEMAMDPVLQQKLPYCTDLPIQYFRGTSEVVNNERAISRVKGFACLCPGARQVRWKFIFCYLQVQSQEWSDQWQLEGVQPGGVRSGGIYGMWKPVSNGRQLQGPFFIGPAEVYEAEAGEAEEDDEDAENEADNESIDSAQYTGCTTMVNPLFT